MERGGRWRVRRVIKGVSEEIITSDARKSLE